MRSGSLIQVLMLRRRDGFKSVLGVLCTVFAFSFVWGIGVSWADENEYKIDSKDHDVTESRMVGREIGQDPFAFETAEQMYKSGPEKPYDAFAEKIIEAIDKNFPENYQDAGQEGFNGMLRQLHPFRKTEAVQKIVSQWARRYFDTTLKTPPFSWRDYISIGFRKIGFGGDEPATQGDALYKKGDFNAASEQYRKQLRQEPLQPDPRNNLALSQLHLGNDLSAQFEFELLRLIKPDYLPAQINLSVMFERIGRTEDAQNMAIEAFNQKKGVAITAFNAAWFQNLKGEYENAVNSLTPYAELNIKPKYTEFHKVNRDLLNRFGKVHKTVVAQKAVDVKANKTLSAIQENATEGKRPPLVSEDKPKPVDQTLTAEDMCKKARSFHLKGGSKNYGLALEWYRKAAEQGHADAMKYIGSMYELGEGEPKDLVKASDWYRRAADKGNVTAMYNLGVMYAKGKGVAQNGAKAIQWYRQAAALGDSDAMNNLGVCNETGQGVAESPVEAARWYQMAADKGHAEAMVNLGRLYENGKGVSKDRNRAILLYEKAAALGNGSAMNSLGMASEEKKDYTAAVQWYRKAIEKGHPGATGNLAYCYETGRGTPKDTTKALEYYRKAADLGNKFAKDALKRLE